MEVKGIETNRGGKVMLHRQKDGSVRTNIFGSWEILTQGQELEIALEIARLDKIKRDYTDKVNELLSLRDNANVAIAPKLTIQNQMAVSPNIVEEETKVYEPIKTKIEIKPKTIYPKVDYSKEELSFMEETINDYIDFSKDLDFDPSIRNINCFAYACHDSLKFAQEYYVNRLKIVGGEWELASEKVKSEEFALLVEKFEAIRMSKNVINERLKIYFGIPGGGKTTQALQEANNNCILCNSSMLPSDLIEDFKLKDGKGNLIPSPLRHAIEYGEKIVLDEIGTLTLDCLRMLQGLTDNKEYFKYKDEVIRINEGFQIIGTMNLFVNGTAYPLTEALGDRICWDGLKEFKLTPKKLLNLSFI